MSIDELLGFIEEYLCSKSMPSFKPYQ
jgi:hypothetical protein